MKWYNQLSVRRVVLDGTLLSGLMSGLIGVIFAYNPQILHDDYPPDIREKAPPMTQRDKKQRLLFFGPSLAILFGIPLLSNLRLRRQNKGKLSYANAFLNAYLVGSVGNAFDFAVLDYLIGVRLQPKFMILTGTEGMAGYKNVRFHFVAFLKGSVIFLVASLLIAAFTKGKETGQKRGKF